MGRYVAFLRAINVGGHTVKMESLRHHFAALGLRDIVTYIASGNVSFTTRAGDARALERKIERRLKYIPFFEEVLPAKKVALFLQLDRRIGLLTDLGLAANIPVVQP